MGSPVVVEPSRLEAVRERIGSGRISPDGLLLAVAVGDEAARFLAGPDRLRPGELLVTTRTEELWRRPGSWVLGRTDKKADLVVPGKTVSRAHARIEAHDELGWVLTDLGSTSGTFVDGRRVQRVVVRGARRLKLGEVEVGLTADVQERRSPPAPFDPDEGLRQLTLGLLRRSFEPALRTVVALTRAAVGDAPESHPLRLAEAWLADGRPEHVEAAAELVREVRYDLAGRLETAGRRQLRREGLWPALALSAADWSGPGMPTVSAVADLVDLLRARDHDAAGILAAIKADVVPWAVGEGDPVRERVAGRER